MNKYCILLLLAISLCVSFGLISYAEPHNNRFGDDIVRNSTAANSVDFITLSHAAVFIPCKIGYVPNEKCPDNTIVNVTIRGAAKLDDKESEINYKVSGGRIIGTGENVKWDLSDIEKAGIYTITADFVDFNNKKQSKTETVTVRNCDCPNDCVCPNFFVTGSVCLKPGDAANFTATVSDENVKEYFYNWTLSQGTIVSGQGTREILIKTTPDMSGTIKATVEISPVLCENCSKIESTTIEFVK